MDANGVVVVISWRFDDFEATVYRLFLGGGELFHKFQRFGWNLWYNPLSDIITITQSIPLTP